MSSEQMIAFAIFAMVAAVTPGPSNVILTSVGANIGVIRGLPSLLGVSLGMGLMMFLVAFGLGSLILENPTIIQLLKWCGIGLIFWLAWKIATAGRSDAASTQGGIGFWQTAAFQWVNPKSWLVCASATGAYLQANSGSAVQQSLVFGALFILVSLPSCCIWLVFGATLQSLMQTERTRQLCNRAMGAILAASVLLFIL